MSPCRFKSSDADYVLVHPGVSLRVKHTLAVAVDESGADETDAAEIRDDLFPAVTGDFWFNHWQGPHITGDRAPTYNGAGIRRHSVNRFGPADALQSQRRQLMISGPVTAPLPPSPAHAVASEILSDIIDSVVGSDRIPNANSPTEDVADATEIGGCSDTATLSESRILAGGVDNPAYEPADEVDSLAVRSGFVPGSVHLADVTTESTCTDGDDCAGRGDDGGGGGGCSPRTGELLSNGGAGEPGNIGRSGSSTTLHSITDQKPLLLFIHGVGDSMDVWTQQVKFFSNLGYECLTLDLIGHGFSSAPPIGRSVNCLYHFGSVLDQLRTVYYRYAAYYRHVVLIGHAYGSSLATALCREVPNVTLLILVSCGGPTRLVPPGLSYRRLLPVWFLVCLRPLLMCGFKSRELFFSQRGKHYKPVCPSSTPSHVVDAFIRGQEWTEGDVLFHRHIQIPTLLVYGMRDQQVSLVDMCEMEKAIPRAFLETIPSAGHVPQQETAAEFNYLIHQFLTRWRHLLR